MYFWCLAHFSGSPPTMSIFNPIFSIWVFSILILFVASNSSVSLCPHQFLPGIDRKFEQKTDRFWEFEEQSNSWVEVELPYDLISCVNDNCTKVGSIGKHDHQGTKQGKTEKVEREAEERERKKKDDGIGLAVLPVRKRVRLIKMSENSVWVVGVSGSIYERYWNGVQWVIAPHDLPVLAGPANSVFIVNQTIFALSEAGNLFQVISHIYSI